MVHCKGQALGVLGRTECTVTIGDEKTRYYGVTAVDCMTPMIVEWNLVAERMGAQR